MLPHAPATYALLLRAMHSCRLQIGKLGEQQVQPGFYIYVGSAFGPGGLQGRLSHHLQPRASPHWHIDYLRQAAEVVEVWAADSPEKREHEWSRLLGGCPECSIPLRRFGASDCRCPAHLFFLLARPTLEWFSNLVSTGWKGDPPWMVIHDSRR